MSKITRLVLGAVVFLALTSPVAHAISFVGPDGQPVTSEWNVLVARQHVPAPNAVVEPVPDDCDGPVTGCTVDSTAPWPVYASNAWSFYFEEGHVDDWSTLTPSDRTMLAYEWHVTGWPWTDTPGSIEAGAAQGIGLEDGLEGDYAYMYALCAMGEGYATHHVQLQSIPGVETADIRTRFNTCAFIRQLGAR